MELDFGAWDAGVRRMHMIAAHNNLDFPVHRMFAVGFDLQVKPALLL